MVMKTEHKGIGVGRGLLAGLTLIGISFAASLPSFAQSGQGVQGVQDAPAGSHEQYRDIINSNTLTAIGSGLTGGNIKLIDDIAAAVNDGHKMRLLPMLGEGSSQNIRDILYLRGVDV